MSPFAPWRELILKMAMTKAFQVGGHKVIWACQSISGPSNISEVKSASYWSDPAQEKQRSHFCQTSLSWLKPRHVAKHSP